MSKVKKVRYTLTKLRYIFKNNPLSGYRYVDLVSNWVEIDAAVFARLLEGRISVNIQVMRYLLEIL